MWVEFNNNPRGIKIGDCAVRAVSKAIGQDWTDVWKIVNETMEIIKVVQPDIYKSVIERLSDT